MLTEVVVELEDEIGALARLEELLGAQGVNIRALAVVRVIEEGRWPTWWSSRQTSPCAPFATTTWSPSVREVLSVTLEDEAGALGRYCRQLADASINLEAVYLAGDRNGAKEQ